jgi:hypothetical protein
MKLAPLIARFSPGLAIVVPDQLRQRDILAAKSYRFFGPQPAVVKHSEERDQPGTAGLLNPHGF